LIATAPATVTRFPTSKRSVESESLNTIDELGVANCNVPVFASSAPDSPLWQTSPQKHDSATPGDKTQGSESYCERTATNIAIAITIRANIVRRGLRKVTFFQTELAFFRTMLAFFHHLKKK
jgi:hypothetical protein